jgi:hypothetical protein
MAKSTPTLTVSIKYININKLTCNKFLKSSQYLINWLDVDHKSLEAHMMTKTNSETSSQSLENTDSKFFRRRAAPWSWATRKFLPLVPVEDKLSDGGNNVLGKVVLVIL